MPRHWGAGLIAGCLLRTAASSIGSPARGGGERQQPSDACGGACVVCSWGAGVVRPRECVRSTCRRCCAGAAGARLRGRGLPAGPFRE